MTYFGVDYEILFNGTKFNSDNFRTLMNSIKLEKFNVKIYSIKD